MGIDGVMIKTNKTFAFEKVAHLEFTLYRDFWLSHHGDCATFQKNPFPVKSVIMKSTTAAPFQSVSK